MRTRRKVQLVRGEIMLITDIKKCLIATALLLFIGSGAEAATLWVNCGATKGLTSINTALKLVQSHESDEPNTINVSGTCHENILIQHMDQLTLNAVNGASITDASYGTHEVIDVENSTRFTLNGFTITTTCPSSCIYERRTGLPTRSAAISAPNACCRSTIRFREQVTAPELALSIRSRK